MAKGIRLYIMELLQVYEEMTKRTCMEMALDFDITLSNLYQYRNGTGNPTAETIDKIVEGVANRCPEALEKVEWKKTDGNKKEENTDSSV